MALSTGRYGHATSAPSSPTELDIIQSGKSMGSVWYTASSDIWGTEIYVYGARSGGSTGTAQAALYTTDGNSRPSILMDFTSDMSFGSSVLGWKNANFATAHQLIRAGEKYAIMTLGLNNPIVLGGNTSWGPTYKQDVSGFPSPAEEVHVTSLRGLAMYVLGYQNVPPLAPSNMSPTGSIATATPTFTADFRDLNGAYGASSGNGVNSGDKLYKVKIDLMDDTSTVIWTKFYTATAGEQTANQSQTLYDGPALVGGESYTWRVWHYDLADRVSEASAFGVITMADLGTVTTDASPTGTIDLIDNIVWQGRWNHQSGLAMNQARVRIRQGSADGTVILTSPAISKAAASSALPGTLFTLTDAETGFGALEWGQTYYYEIQGRDSASNWSPYSSPPRQFITNYPPSVPSGLSPTGGDVYTSPPTLSFNMTDQNDTSPGDLTAVIRLTYADGMTKDITPTYNSTTLRWERLLTSAELTRDETQRVTIQSTTAPTGGTFTLTFSGQTTAGIAWNAAASAVKSALDALSNIDSVTVALVSTRVWDVTFDGATIDDTDQPMMTGSAAGLTGGSGHSVVVTEKYKGGNYLGTISWKATGYDNVVYSGGSTSLATATFSASTTFNYSTGPSVVITAPVNASTQGYSAVELAFTAATSVKYRVKVYPLANGIRSGTSAYDSGQIISAAQTHTIPSGYLINGNEYELELTVWDNLDLPGTATVRFTISFTAAPDITGFMAIPQQIGNDPFPASIGLFWDPTTIPTNQFRHYSIWRTGGGEERRLLFVKEPHITQFIDNTPRSGIQYTYKLRQVVREGVLGIPENNVDSDEAITLGQVDLKGVVLSSVENGENYRCVLHYAEERSHVRQVEEAMFVPLAGKISPITGRRLPPKPVTIRSTAYWWETDGIYELITDQYATAQDRLDDLEKLDASRHVIAYRDERGRQKFVRIVDLQVIDKRPFRYTLAMTFREEDYTEGEI